jgi:Mg-chelatase subunit ChlD
MLFPFLFAACLLLGTPSDAACLSETEPNETPEQSGLDRADPAFNGAICVRGKAEAGHQDMIAWRVPAGSTAWRLRLEAPPGVNGRFELVQPANGNEKAKSLWRGEIDARTGLIESPPLLLKSGPAVLAVAAAGAPLRWRMYTEAVATPPVSAPAPLSDAFSTMLVGTSNRLKIPWTLSAEAAERLWDLSLLAAPGEYTYLDVVNAEGATVFSVRGNAWGGVARASDLRLKAGTYTITVAEAKEGMPFLIAASAPAAGAAALAPEPDYNLELAHPLGVGQPIEGRLIASDGDTDKDVYLLDVAAAETNQISIVVSHPPNTTLDIQILNDKDQEIHHTVRSNGGTVRLEPLAFPPGRYGIKISGNMGDAPIYKLALESMPPLAKDQESEPNDIIDFATRFSQGSVLKGKVDATDRDHLALVIPPGPLRWWTITARSSGALSMEFYSGAQATLASAASREGEATTLARMPLAPGRHVLRLQGSGEWQVSAEPVPEPGPSDEREPNDALLSATRIEGDAPMRFWLDHLGDQDAFAIRLEAMHRLALAVRVPKDVQPTGRLTLSAPATEVALEFAEDPANPAMLLATWEGPAAAGEHLLRLYGGGSSDQSGDVQITLAPPYAEANIKGTIVLVPPAIASDDPLAQIIRAKAVFDSVPGTGAVRVVGWVSDDRWRLSELPATIRTRTSPLEISLALEAPPYLTSGEGAQWAVALFDEATGQPLAVANGRTSASKDAPASNPQPATPLPAPLLGALDAARVSFGANPGPEDLKALTDGLVDGKDVPLRLNEMLEFDLAGDALLPVLGFVLTPPALGDSGKRLRQFRLEAGGDDSFRTVWEGEITPQERPQAFVLAEPVMATALRLTPLGTWASQPGDTATLSTFSALVAPEHLPVITDLAKPEWGGHVIRASKTGVAVMGEAPEWPGRESQFNGENDPNPEWVMGFFRNRAAAISSVAVTLNPAIAPEQRIAKLAVYSSETGPFGPWTSIGTLRFSEEVTTATLKLDQPLWSRCLRFVVTPTGPDRPYFPASIVIEEDRAAGGGTILGEWGQFETRALFERIGSKTAEAESVAAGKTNEASAVLPPETWGSGRIADRLSTDWYRLEPPAKARTLIFQSTTDGAEFALQDAAGAAVAMQRSPEGIIADVVGRQGPFQLAITKPPYSVVVAWDTSGSVGAFSYAIIGAIQNLTAGMANVGTTKDGGASEIESLNFVPFRTANSQPGAKPLLPEFATDRASASAGLQAYSGLDSDSDSSTALIVASRALAERPGRRAIILITDASFYSESLQEMWSALDAARPKIFALRVPSGTLDVAARQQEGMMQDWASLGGGEQRLFAAPADAEPAFRALVARLREPANYRVSWRFETEPPKPAMLRVAAAAAETGETPLRSRRAIGLVLDASGSMLQRVDGTRKIELAKRIVLDLVEKVLPEETPFALRVFGVGGVGSCDSSAIIPLAPLDRTAARQAIGGIKALNGAKTAIAASLRAASTDLEAAKNGQLIVLVTDGEETCDGDPTVEIKALRAAGIDVRLNIVGFDLSDATLRQQFAEWAKDGSGAYFDANNAAELQTALRAAVAPTFQVLAADKSVVARGTVDGPAVELPSGTYQIVVDSVPPWTKSDLALPPSETTTVEITVK